MYNVGNCGKKWRTPVYPAFATLKEAVEHMFLGQYQHSLDEKGRLTIPARFRETLEGGAYITQGFDRCLMVMTASYFDQVYQRMNAMNLADPNVRLLRRQILSNAFSVEADKVGRILMPQKLREFIGLDSEAIIAGQGDYFEIWNPTLWDEQVARIQDTETNNQRFSALDLSNQ
jgi:MraZ protein